MSGPRANALETALLDLVAAGYLRIDTRVTERICVSVESALPIVEPDRLGFGMLGGNARVHALYACVVAAHAAGHPAISLLEIERTLTRSGGTTL